MKVSILAVGVHPDDVELGCSGTLLRQIELGHRVGLLDLTRGELGSRGSAELRDQEAAKAAEMMGAQFRDNLRMADGFFTHSHENLMAIVSVIRRCQPNLVLANALSDRHPDHGRAAKLVADACYYSGLSKVESFDQHGQPQKAWRPKAVYHYIQDHNLVPDFVVDISTYIDRKIELVQAFGSQFYSPGDQGSNEPQTPISSKQFMDFVRAKAATYGRPAGFDFAEGFQVSRTPGLRNLFDLE